MGLNVSEAQGGVGMTASSIGRERSKLAEEVLTCGALPSPVFDRLRWAPGNIDSWAYVWLRRHQLTTDERVVFDWLAGEFWALYPPGRFAEALAHCSEDAAVQVVAAAGVAFTRLTIRQHADGREEVAC